LAFEELDRQSPRIGEKSTVSFVITNMTEDEIAQILRSENLTADQFRAATDQANEVLCLACAGSGKSTTLAFRIARLLALGEPPQSLVAITFTEKAAESIKLKVAQTLPKLGLPAELLGAMYIGTVHSFCKNLLGEIDAVYRQFDVLDENRLVLYLISRYGEIGIQRIRDQRAVTYFEAINNVTAAWLQMNNEALSFESIEREDPTLGLILRNIHELLERDEFVDYSMMIRHIVTALDSNDPVVNRAVEQLRHIMVDEYQDTYPLQDRLFRGLHRRTRSLFVVGDDDQSIYGWNGADVSNIMSFETNYPQCSRHTLSINFRSTDVIVDSSSGFIARQLGAQRMPKNPVPAPHNLGHVNQLGKYFFQDRDSEAEWVAERISSLLGKCYVEGNGQRGLCPGDFAILMKSTLTDEADGHPRHTPFTNALRQRGIDFYIESEGSIFNFPSVNLLRITFELLRESNLDRDRLRQFFDGSILPVFPNADFDSVSRVLSTWQRDIHQPGRRKVKPQQLVHDILEAYRFPLTNFPDMEIHAIGQFSKIMNDVESVYFSIDTTHRFASILNFLNYLVNPRYGDDYETSSDHILQRPDAVFISTIHKAKGLEFPVVFVVDVQSGRFPGNRRNYSGWLPRSLMNPAIQRGAYQNNREGEIRLFYTAITRAERFLYVTGCQTLPAGRRQNQQSVFWQELNHDQISTDSTTIPAGLQDENPRPRIDENVMPTSFSEIRYYLLCPKNYQFRKQFGFNPVVPDLYGYGLTIHTSIGKLHQDFVNQAPTQQEAETTTRNTFHLKHVPPSQNNNPGPYERGLENAVNVVNNYVRDYQTDFTFTKQVEQRFEIPARHTVISGAIDLLVHENEQGEINDVTVIDFKSMNAPDEGETLDWTELSLQVQLYARASNLVLGQNARTGSVHLLRDNQRVEIPIDDESINRSVRNIEWAVDRIIEEDFPMRPAQQKCAACDFRQLCSKVHQDFRAAQVPPPISVPNTVSREPLMVKAFSQVDNRP
jgi:DNA helicase II / ATP-dependent DNA helicase PcrA